MGSVDRPPTGAGEATSPDAPRAGLPRRTVVFVVDRPIAPDTVPALTAHVEATLRGSDADLVVCDVGGLGEVDVATVEALARCQVTARRLGHVIRLRHASPELRDLLSLLGLCEALPPPVEPSVR